MVSNAGAAVKGIADSCISKCRSTLRFHQRAVMQFIVHVFDILAIFGGRVVMIKEVSLWKGLDIFPLIMSLYSLRVPEPRAPCEGPLREEAANTAQGESWVGAKGSDQQDDTG